MKKSVSLVLSAIMVLCLLAGCSSENPTDSETTGETTSQSSSDTSADTPKETTAAETDEDPVLNKLPILWTGVTSAETDLDCKMTFVSELADGGYIAVGTVKVSEEVSAAYYGRFNADGQEVWGKTIENIWLSKPLATDQGYVLSGTIPQEDETKKVDALIKMIDENGNDIWETKVSGSENDSLQNAVLNQAGNYVLCGYTASTDGDVTGNDVQDRDGLVVEIDPNGNIVSVNTYGGSGAEGFNTIIPMADGGYAGVLWSSSTDGIVSIPEEYIPAEGKDYNSLVLKINSDKEVEYCTVLGGSKSDFIYSLQEAEANTCIVTGYTQSTDRSFKDNIVEGTGYIAKILTDGTPDWVVYPGVDYVNRIKRVSDNEFLLCGAVSVDGDITIGWLGEIDASGKIVLENKYTGDGTCSFDDVVPSLDGGIVCAGSNGAGTGNWDWNAVLVKFNSAK